MTSILNRIGFDDETIKKLPHNIVVAAAIVEKLQQIYLEVPKEYVEKKRAIAQTIAESTRSLLIRINAIVAVPQEVKERAKSEQSRIPAPAQPTPQPAPQPTPQPTPQRTPQQLPRPKPKPRALPKPQPMPSPPAPEPPKPKREKKKEELSQREKDIIERIKKTSL